MAILVPIDQYLQGIPLFYFFFRVRVYKLRVDFTSSQTPGSFGLICDDLAVPYGTAREDQNSWADVHPPTILGQ